MTDNWLVFVDTNILLDFYRLRGASALKQLKALEQNRAKLIVTEQVQMEFLKHRQNVVLEAISGLKKPDEQKMPPFLSEYQPATMMRKNIAEAVSQYKKTIEKAERILVTPQQHDDVYKALMRVFKKGSEYSLDRDHPEKFKLRSLARKRFFLGYPPRKKDDSSAGDALNWEWIIHCAQSCELKSNVIIVSRDGDYGVKRGSKSLINEWLKREFQERVSKKRKVELTELLTTALKKLDVKVSKEDVQEEKRVVNVPRLSGTDLDRLRKRLNSVATQMEIDPELIERLNKINMNFRDIANKLNNGTE